MSSHNEKARFFAYLEGLDECSENEDEGNQAEPRKRQKTGAEKTRQAADILPQDAVSNGTSKAHPPLLKRACTELGRGPVDTQSARCGPIGMRRTNSEPQPSLKATKKDIFKSPSNLFAGLTFCKCSQIDGRRP